jgi:hypothetical protein
VKLEQLSVVATLLLSSSLTFGASPIFSDDFDSYASVQLNWSPPASSGWTVTNGTVDVIGIGGFNFIPGNGNYIDLDGSSSNAGLLSHSVDLLGGTTYMLSFDLAGSHRGTPETVDVSFGSVAASYSSLNSTDPFSTHTLNFTPDSHGSYSLSFQNVGGDNFGALLDNVHISVVPEPEVYAMLLAGLALVGFTGRRRKTV